RYHFFFFVDEFYFLFCMRVVFFLTFFVTMLPAAIIAFSPIVTPARIVEFARIDAPSLLIIFSSLKFLFPDFGYLSLQKVTFGPMNTLSSISIPSQIWTPFFMVTLFPIFTSFSMNTCEQILQFAPI